MTLHLWLDYLPKYITSCELTTYKMDIEFPLRQHLFIKEYNSRVNIKTMKKKRLKVHKQALKIARASYKRSNFDISKTFFA